MLWLSQDLLKHVDGQLYVALGLKGTWSRRGIQLDRDRHWGTQFPYIGLLPVKTVTICVPVRAPRGIFLSVKPGPGVSFARTDRTEMG